MKEAKKLPLAKIQETTKHQQWPGESSSIMKHGETFLLSTIAKKVLYSEICYYNIATQITLKYNGLEKLTK